MKNFTLRISVLIMLLLSAFEVNAQIGNALYFDGNDDWIGTTGPGQGGEFVTGAFTVEAWVLPMHATKVMTILSTRQPNDMGFDIKIQDGNNIRVNVSMSNAWVSNQNFAYNYTVGKWMHIACTVGMDNYQVYVNGELIGSAALGGNGGVFLHNNHAIRIGAYGTNEYFQGAIDELKVYEVARTQAQVKLDMMATSILDYVYATAYYHFNHGFPGGNNGGQTTIADQQMRYPGYLVNFGLNGNTSNWISSYATVVPTAIAASNRAANQFTANWTAPSAATATDYLLDVSTSPNFTSFVGSYQNYVVSGTSANVTGLTPGTVYYYRVSARNAAQHVSMSSNVITVDKLNILDLAGLTGYVSSPAYSLRKLSSSYNGPAITVRRSSDNATQDIGFTNGNLNTTALLSFVGSASGYVTKWFDQSNAGYHAVQTNMSLLPRIVNQGAIEKFNNRPAVYFNGTHLATDRISMFNLGTTLVAAAKGNTATGASIVTKTGMSNGSNSHIPAPFDFTNADHAFVIGNGTNYSVASMNGQNATSNVPASVYSFILQSSGSGNSFFFRNSNSSGTIANVPYADNGNALIIGNRADNGGLSNVYISEIIMGNGMLSERYAVETSQIGYYVNNNANLSAIALSSGTVSPAVSPTQTSYTATVTNATTSITVTPTVSDPNASSIGIRIGSTSNYTNLPIGATSAPLALNEGYTTIELYVTAQNGMTSKSYSITVFRGSGNNNLSALKTSAGSFSTAFEAGTTSYNTSKTALSSVTVTPTLSDSNASIQTRLNGGAYSSVASGSASSAMSLNVGSNTIDIRITAVDGTTKTYSIQVTRVVPNTLDLIGLTAATPSVPAYSVRKLSSNYGGPAFQVRRSTDNVLYDASLDQDGNIYEGPLLSFAQGATLYVTKWYDQSGFGYDAIQTNTTLQPIIAEAGVIRKINKKPALHFGTSNLATSKEFMFENGVSMVGFAKGASATPSAMVTKTGNGNGSNQSHPGPFDFTNNGGQFTVGNSASMVFSHSEMDDVNPRADVSTTVPASVYSFTIPTTGSYTTYRNGAQTATNTIIDYKDGGNMLMLGNRASLGSNGNVYTSEVIMFNTALSNANRQTVENSQTNFFANANANLASLSIHSNTISPAFNTNTTTYNSAVNTGYSTIMINASTESAFASLQARVNNGSFTAFTSSVNLGLNIGDNIVEVQVTSQGGTVKTYTINVLRQSDNAQLSGLSTNTGTVNFDTNTYTYNNLTSNSETITVTPTVAESNATVEIRVGNGSYAPAQSGVASQLSLAFGNNNIAILVTAQNGSTKTYYLAVYRNSDNANLINLNISNTDVPLIAGQQSYSITLGGWLTSTYINALCPANATISMRVNGGAYFNVESGTGHSVGLAIGSNLVDLRVTAQDGITQKVYNLNLIRKSNVATIASISALPQDLFQFNSAIETYNLTVPHYITNIFLTPKATYSSSTIQVNVNGGPFTTVPDNTMSPSLILKLGFNTVILRVTAEETSAVKDYTLNITRFSSNAELSGLTTTAGSISFQPLTTQYNLVAVSNSTESVTVRPTFSHPNATAKVRVNNGSYTALTNGANSAPIPLAVGNNDIDIEVRAESGNTKNYRLSFRRKSNDNDLSALAISDGSLSFSASILSYTTTTAATTASITVTPTASYQSHSVIAVRINNGIYTAVNSGSPSDALSLNFGDNPIDIKVTSEEGTEKVYSINAKRFSDNANLSALTTTAGSISFTPETTTYTTSVSNATTSVTITPTKADLGALIEFSLNGGNFASIASGGTSNPLSLNVGNNTIDIRVTAQNGTTKIYSLTVDRRSVDANLSALSISSGSISFAEATTSYSATVSNATSSVTVTPTRSDANATIEIRVNNGNYTTVSNASASNALALNVGNNTIDVKVTAQDGNSKTYTITIQRYSNDDTLSALTISAGNISFSPSTLTYSTAVNNTTQSVNVTPTVSHPNATLMVRVNNGTFTNLISGDMSSALALNNGMNTIDIQVTSQDSTVKTYTITIERQSNNADLSSLATSTGTISFNSATTNYSMTVANATASMKVNAAKADNDAVMQIRLNGDSYNILSSGTDSDNLPLSIGNNTIDIKVTAQDGTEKTYTILVLRPSNDANLTNLSTSAGSIAFSSSVNSYNLTVLNSVETVSVLASTDSQANSTIEIRVNGGNYNAVLSGNTSSDLGLDVGNNLIEIKVTAQDGTENSYTISILRPSSNNTLSSIITSVGSLSPTFDSNTTNYNILVSNSDASIRVTPIPAETNATLKIRLNNGNYTALANGDSTPALALQSGNNTIDIEVTAQDGLSVSTYTLTVLRPHNDANLTSLSLASIVLSPMFSTEVISYTATVDNDIYETSLTASLSQQDAVMEILTPGNPPISILSGDTSPNLSLNIGNNTFEVKVTAQDGTVKTYSISIKRLSNDSSLSSLQTDSGTLTPDFDPAVLTYDTIIHTTEAVVTSVANDTNAVQDYRINNGPYTTMNGNVSQPLPLQTGNNTIDIRVTAENGQETIYTINVLRPSTNALLSSLSTSLTNFNLNFDPETTLYSGTANGSNYFFTFLATASDPNSAITFNTNGSSYTAINNDPVALAAGSNTINILVTAQDGIATKTYTLDINRVVGNTLNVLGLTNNTPATNAYSLRKLSATFTGSAVKVRRASDNAVQNIGFDANGDFDSSALLSFAANSAVYVERWYDQSGLGIDLYQDDLSQQPILAENGVMKKFNNKSSIYFNGKNLQTDASILYPYGVSMVATAKGYGATPSTIAAKTNANVPAPFDFTNSEGHFYVGSSTSFNSINTQISGLKSGVTESTTGTTYSFTIPFSGTYQNYIDGNIGGSNSIEGYGDNGDALRIGNRNDFGGHGNVELPEIVLFSKELSTQERETIETSQRNYYQTRTAQLSALTLSTGTFSQQFIGANLNYTATIPFSSSSMTIKPVSTATIEVSCNDSAFSVVTSNTDSQQLSLNPGNNVIKIRVSNNNLTNIYTINAARTGDCPYNGYFNSQYDVDNFAVNYPDCTVIEGNFSVSGSVTSLLPLQNLTSTGNVTISYTTLENLNGLLNLTKIGNLYVANNGSLQSIEALSGLTKLARLDLHNNNTLASLEGLQNITQVNGNIYLSGQSSVTSLNGLRGLTSVNGSIEIRNFASIIDLSGLENIQAEGITGFKVYYNSLLEHANVKSVCNYISAGGTPEIFINKEPGFANSLEDVIADCNTSVNNPNLSALTLSAGALLPAFDSNTLQYGITVPFATNATTVTPSAAHANATIAIRINGGNYATVNNGNASASLSLIEGNNTIDVLVSAEDGSTQKAYTILINRTFGCPDGPISLTSQAMVDDFIVDYPNCTNFIGNLSITGSDITNLSGIANIINVNGTLSITNTNLTSLLGWSNLSSITNLTLTNNPVLVSSNVGAVCNYLTAGTGVTQISNNATGSNNAAEILAACNATFNNANLVSLTTTGGTISPAFDSTGLTYTLPLIDYNVASVTVTPTAAVSGIAIAVRINNGTFETVNSGLASSPLNLIDGNNVVEVKTTAPDGTTTKIYSITFTKHTQCPVGNFAITTQAEADNFAMAYPDCTQINGDLTISGSVNNLTALDNLTSVTGSLDISNTSVSNIDILQGMAIGKLKIANSPINNLSPLSGFTAINELELNNLPITNLNGLESFTTINKLIIANNTSLTSLSALQNLTSSATLLVIDGNTQLASLSGLDNIILANTASLKITTNPLLTYASVKSICEYISAGGNGVISNNGYGSSTQSELFSQCHSTYYNSSLLNLTSSTGGVLPAISWNTYDYTLTSTSVNENPITITPYTSFAGASVEIKVNEGSYYPAVNNGPNQITLNLGTNTINIKIISQSGSASSVYNATVEVLQQPNILDGVGLTAGNILSPAYSVRRISSEYTGPAMKVRNSVGAEMDIDFTAQGDLDTDAILAMGGNGPVGVIVWYDQSGNGINMTQPVTNNAPLIANGGNIFTHSNKPILHFGGNGFLSTAAQVLFSNGVSMVGVAKGNSGPAAFITKTGNGNSNTGNPGPFEFTSSANEFRVGNAMSFTSHDMGELSVKSSVSQSVYAFTIPNTSGQTAHTFRNGSQSGSHMIWYYADNGNPLMIGNKNDMQSPSSMYASEITLFNKVLSDSDRNTIETSQRNYFIDTSADLVNLTMSSGTPPIAFASNLFTYSTSVSNSVTSVTITPTSSNSNAYGIVKVNGTQIGYVNSGNASPSLSLVEGDNTIEFISLSDTSGTTYTIHVSREIICPLGDVTITQQSELDNFVTLYPDCTALNGGLFITGATDITSLAQLQNLTQVRGHLSLTGNTALASLSGLENMSNIWYDLVIANSPLITSLSPLQNLQYVGQGIEISSIGITSLSGLGSVPYATKLIVKDCPNLTSISGLTSLQTLYNTVEFSGNTLLANISGIKSTNISGLGNLTISNNPQLSIGIQNICTYLSNGGNSAISNNASGSSSVSEVLATCDVISTYTNLSSLSTTAGTLSPTFSAATLTYSAPAITTQTVGITASAAYAGSTLSVRSNSGTWVAMANGIESTVSAITGSNTVEVKVTSATGDEKIYTVTFNAILPCPTGDLFLYSQSAVDDFIIEYPNCTSLDGLQITGTITNLNGLANITNIQGSLTVYNATDLTSLAGLENLTTIGSGIYIYWNDILTNITALNNLQSLNTIYITGNPALSNVAIDPICEHLGEGKQATISGNATGASNTVEVMTACGNANLLLLSSIETSAGFIPGFSETGYSFSQNVPGSISTFTVTPTAYSSNATITITLNGNAQTVQSGTASQAIPLAIGMNYVYVNVVVGSSSKDYVLYLNQASVCPSNSMYLSSQTDVDNFIADYPGCTNFDGSLYLSGNITNLNGLANIVSITGTIRIMSSDLTDLSGLENMTSVGQLNFDSNNLLTDISAISNVSLLNSTSFQITNNPNLADIALPNICAYLATGNSAAIWLNTIGANSKTEVMAACGNSASLGLSDLSTSAGAISGFDPMVTSYNQSVLTDSITITPTAYNPNAVIKVYRGPDEEIVVSGETSQVYPLDYGSNTFYVYVTVGVSTKSYLLNINRNTECPQGGLYLYSQADVDNFIVNYPNCTTIENDIYISSTDITNLNALSNITTVNQGELLIINTSLQNLNGLQNITALDYVYIQSNTLLTDISALSDVVIDPTGYLNLTNNTSLANASVPSVCTYIGSGGAADFFNNATGADSMDAAFAGCGNPYALSLVSIMTSDGAVPDFDPFEQNSNITVMSETITITPNAQTASAVIKISDDNTGNEIVLASGETSAAFNLEYGINYFFLEVKVGNSTKYYTLRINRTSSCPQNINLYSQQDVDDFPIDYPTCSAVMGSIYIDGSDEAITDLSALSNITSVVGSINIYDTNIQNLNGLHNLTSFGELSLESNQSLTDVSVLDEIGLGNTDYLSFDGNSNLATIAYPSICNYIANGNNIYVYGNAAGAQNTSQVMSACGIVNPAKLLTLTTSEGIVPGFDPDSENFSMMVDAETITITPTASDPASTIELINFDNDEYEVVPNGMASTTQTVDEDGTTFLVIVSVGNFRTNYFLTVTKIGTCPVGNVTYTTQQAVDDFITTYPLCTELPANLTLTSANITNIDAFQNIVSIGGQLRIGETSITNLSAFGNLEYIGGNLDIFSNTGLQSLAGLENLETIGNSLQLDDNNISSLSVLANLTSVGSNIEISDEKITDLNGLQGITQIENLYLQSNSNMISLSGLENLTAVEYFELYDCPVLNDVSALSALTAIEGMYLGSLPALTSLNGLQNIATIGNATEYGFYIYDCNGLTDFSALQNLTNVRGPVSIESCNGLTSLSGLDNMIMSNVTSLYIEYNSNLSDASLPNICAYLSANGEATINNNTSGANTIAEVSAACSAAVCQATTIWNGTSWTNGNPTADKAVIISGNLTAVSDIDACTFTVKNNAVVNVAPGQTVTVTGNVKVQSGSLSFANNAKLIQDALTATNTNEGDISIQRNVNIRRLDYVYWGSPVADMKLKTFSPGTVNNRFYRLDEPTNAFAVIADVVDATPQALPIHAFESAKGYMIRASNFYNPSPTAPLTTFEGVFTGVPNNGNYTVDITHSAAPSTSLGFNLISNPYPSPISAQAFFDANPEAGTLYFWTHGDQNSASNNYATWNPLGVTPVSGPSSPNGFIQTGQGFLLYAPNVLTTGTKANFTNAMRRNNNDNQFFRTSQPERHRFWLNLSNTGNNSLNQALIGYMEGATEGKDTAMDGILNYAGSSISSKIDNGNYITQGRSLPFNVADIVPLSFNALTAGDYTIRLEQFDGLFSAQDIFLKDNLTGAEQNLKLGSYSFASDAGNFGSRFSIVYQTTLGIENPMFDPNAVVVYKNNDILHINAGITTISSVKIFDIRGRMIYEKSGINATSTSLNDLKAEQQVLLVQITSNENKTVTKRVIN